MSRPTPSSWALRAYRTDILPSTMSGLAASVTPPRKGPSRFVGSSPTDLRLLASSGNRKLEPPNHRADDVVAVLQNVLPQRLLKRRQPFQFVGVRVGTTNVFAVEVRRELIVEPDRETIGQTDRLGECARGVQVGRPIDVVDIERDNPGCPPLRADFIDD